MVTEEMTASYFFAARPPKMPSQAWFLISSSKPAFLATALMRSTSKPTISWSAVTNSMGGQVASVATMIFLETGEQAASRAAATITTRAIFLMGSPPWPRRAGTRVVGYSRLRRARCQRIPPPERLGGGPAGAPAVAIRRGGLAHPGRL